MGSIEYNTIIWRKEGARVYEDVNSKAVHMHFTYSICILHIPCVVL